MRDYLEESLVDIEENFNERKEKKEAKMKIRELKR